jgi:hypothetical protein
MPRIIKRNCRRLLRDFLLYQVHRLVATARGEIRFQVKAA